MASQACLQKSYALPADFDAMQVINQLSDHLAQYRGEPGRWEKVSRRYVDSFDWALHARDEVLFLERCHGESFLCWRSLAAAHDPRALRIDTMPRFATNLPEWKYRGQLAKIFDLRAMLPVMETQVKRRDLKYFEGEDEDELAAYLVLEEQRVAKNLQTKERAYLAPVVRVLPVEGHADAAREIETFFESELSLTPACQPLAAMAFEEAGLKPGAYSSKLDFKLDGAMPTPVALVKIFVHLFKIVELNRPGVCADLDTEFLHDFRIAVRRTRSALGQFKTIFPSDLYTHFNEEFKWLAGITSDHRDLDVYLLKMNEYRSWLPEEVAADLLPLEQFLTRKQKTVHKMLVSHLKSKRYLKLVEDWTSFLEDDEQIGRLDGHDLPISVSASRRIWKAYRSVMRLGHEILAHPDAPAAWLHTLRIKCKKLRYLLEMFASLYPQKKINKLVQALKQLQNNLGDFQDFEVQQLRLQTFASQMMSEGHGKAQTFMPMGRLEVYLQEQQMLAREDFTKQFKMFSKPALAKQFVALFKGR